MHLDPLEKGLTGLGPSLDAGLSAPQTLEQALALLAERERELAALRMTQQEWVHAVSHDLRAPLRHVLSFGSLVQELLQADAISSAELQEVREFLGTMDQSARRMGAMFDGLLLLSRISQQALQWQPVDLAGMVQRAIAQCEAQQDMTGRSVDWQLPLQYPAVRADARLLEQAILAVLSNALKFSRNTAHARISIEVERHADAGVSLSVIDNGVGFEPARARNLFGVFQRMHKEAEFEGLGTGLALVRSICRRHGGTTTIQAEPGKGCLVSLHWPGGLERSQEA